MLKGVFTKIQSRISGFLIFYLTYIFFLHIISRVKL